MHDLEVRSSQQRAGARNAIAAQAAVGCAAEGQGGQQYAPRLDAVTKQMQFRLRNLSPGALAKL